MKKFVLITVLTITIFNIKLNVQAKEGWVTENNNTYYYENDQKVSGFKEIETDEGPKLYFFSRINNALKYGWQNAEEGVWYQNKEGEVVKGHQTIAGQKYYFDEVNGIQKRGFINENNKLYFYSRVDGALKYGWQNAQEGKWYQNKEGEVVKGLQQIDGKYYKFDDNTGIQFRGFVTIGDKLYFYSRVDGALKYGWQNAQEGVWYQNKEGEVVKGSQVIDGKKYLFDSNTGIQIRGFIDIDGKRYFYSRVDGALKYGWQNAGEGKWYQDTDGSLLKGWQVIDKQKYYFDLNTGIQIRGFINIDGKRYFFSRIDGALKYGWQNAGEGKWYQDADGSLLKGWQVIDKQKYYFDLNTGIQIRGFIDIDGKRYFFSRVDGALKYGWQHAEEGYWYQQADGSVFTNPGWNTIDGKEYYFQNNFAYRGIREVEGKKYYFDEDTCEKRYGTTVKRYREIVTDERTGEFKLYQYIPEYYNQKDGRWSNIKLGLSTIGGTGCSPASMAMAYTSILNRQIWPSDVAYYLYYNTDQFNKRLKGTSGMGIIYASNYYGVKCTAVSNIYQLKDALKNGKIVYAAMGNGKFATPKWNHAIILFRYNEWNNTTFSYDPLNGLNNTWNNLDNVWRERSTDPDDLSGGSAFYILG